MKFRLMRIAIVVSTGLFLAGCIGVSQALNGAEYAMYALREVATHQQKYQQFVDFFDAHPELKEKHAREVIILAHLALSQAVNTGVAITDHDEKMLQDLQDAISKCGALNYTPQPSPRVNDLPSFPPPGLIQQQSCTFRDISVAGTAEIGTLHVTGNATIDGNLTVNGSIITPGDTIQPNNIVYVQKSPITAPNQFNTIEAAIAAIAPLVPSVTNPFLIQVTPGIFVENELTMLPYTTLQGASANCTIIQAKVPNQNVIVGNANAILRDVTIVGASAPGFAGVVQGVQGNLIIFDSEFAFCDTFLKIDNPLPGAFITLARSQVLSINDFSYVIQVTRPSLVALAIPSGVFVVDTLWEHVLNPSFQAFGFISGTSTFCRVSSCSFGGVLLFPPGGFCFNLQDGGIVRVVASDVGGFDTAFYLPNVGNPPTLYLEGINITNNTINDVNVQHNGAMGSITGSMSSEKVTIVPAANIPVFITDTPDGGIAMQGPFEWGDTFNLRTDIAPLFKQGWNTGLISGGALSLPGGLIVDAAPGNGYLMANIPTLELQEVEWTSTLSVAVPDNADSFIFVDQNGILQASPAQPPREYAILLGKVRSNAGSILYAQSFATDAVHTAERLTSVFEKSFGVVYISGSLLSQIGADQVDVTSGDYVYGSQEYFPLGTSLGVPVTFSSWKQGVGTYDIVNPSTNVVDVLNWDNSGTLTPLLSDPFNPYTKHAFYISGAGLPAGFESYQMVYGTMTFPSPAAAAAGPLPTTPSNFQGNYARIASFVVGGGAIVQILDERPFPSFQATASTGVTIHGNLAGLLADDHPQYVLTNGGRVMTGNLQMGGNNIVSVGTVNGVTVQAHASRHLPNGADPLPVGTPVDIGTSNFQGIQNTFSRADHIHNHANQPGGSLHAVATQLIAGFMSAADKTNLDTLVSQSGNYVLKTGDSMSGSLTMLNQQQVRLSEQSINGTDYIAFQAPAALPTSYTLTFPTTAGSANTFLTTDGSGNLSWSTISTAGFVVIGGNTVAAPMSIGTLNGFPLSLIANSVTGLTVSTTGTVTLPNLSTTGVVHNSAAGLLTTSLIVNADVDPAAGIVDTKLATISTPGKVLNSATTATSTNTANAIVARDASGNFSAGAITVTGILNGDGTAAAPSYGFTSDSNTGMYRVAADQIGFATNGVNRLTISNSALTTGAGVGLTLSGATSGTVSLQAPASVTTYTLTMPTAVGAANQVLTALDGTGTLTWTTPTVGTVTSVTASSPLASSGGSTPNITIQTASGSQAGALSAADWTTFNNKVSNGGNAYGAAMSIGSTDANSLSLLTNNVARMVISSAGTVTIPNLTPAGVVHNDVNGLLTTSLIVNADVSPTAAIVDTKLATISTAGKVANSATTATSANTASAIVARDASGNFSAGTITVAGILNGDGTAAATTYGFTSDANTGMYHVAANQLGFATGGVNRLTIGNTALTTGAGVGLTLSGATAGTVTLQAPTSVTTYALTFPVNAGLASQVLTTDGTGTLTWTTPTTGTVTSVTASLPLNSSGGATPNISIFTASASQSGALSSTDWTTFNNKVSNGGNAYGAAMSVGTTDVNPLSLLTSNIARLVISSAGTVTIPNLTPAGVVHNSITGLLTTSLIVNADVDPAAAIVDTKLATISTAGKVANSATTATSANTASAIVARDASGNFSAGTITASLTGAASLNVLKAGDTMTGSLTLSAGSVTVSAGNVTIGTNGGSAGALLLRGSTAGTLTIQAPASVTTYTLTMPTAQGTAGQALAQSGTPGTLTWVSPVTTVTATSPLASSGGTTPNLTIQTASGTQAGALSSTDWITFNNKVSNGGNAYGTTMTIGTNDANILNLETNGANRIVIDANGSISMSVPSAGTNPTLTVNGSAAAPAMRLTAGTGQNSVIASIGSAAVPAYSFFGNTSTGMYLPTASQIAFSAAGTTALTIASTGITGGLGIPVVLSGATSGTVSVQAPAAVTSYTLTMPAAQGTAGQALAQSGTPGTLTWVSPVTTVTATSPLASSGGTTPNLTIQTASGSQAGALSSTDWTTFNNKVSNGGNSYGAAMSVGTNDAFGLTLKTNNSNRLSINQNGAVAIAAASSGNSLTVTGGPGAFATALRVIAFAGSPGSIFDPGSSSAPAIVFQGSGNTGIYSPGASQVAVAINAATQFLIDSNGATTVSAPFGAGATASLTVNAASGKNVIAAGSGTAAVPAYSFTGDAASGTYLIASGQLGLATAGVNRVTISSSGIVGAAGLPLTLTGATTGSVSFQAPASVTTYTLTMPATAGSANQVLTTNGTGTLSWTTPTTGTVTSVTATSPLASSGGATPNLTIQTASGSQAGALSSTDWTTFNNKVSNGGNSYGATMSVGTNDANTLNIETNNTTRLSIDANGSATMSVPTAGTNPTLTVNGSASAAAISAVAGTGQLGLNVTGPATGEGAMRVTAGSGRFAIVVGGTGDNGTAANPLITFSGDSHSGLYAAAGGQMSLCASSTERLRVTSGAAMLFCNYRASVYQSTAQTINGTGLPQRINFDTKVFDPNTNYSVAPTNTYTVPVTGIYLVTLTVAASHNSGSLQTMPLYISGAGTTPITGAIVIPAGATGYSTVSGILSLTAGVTLFGNITVPNGVTLTMQQFITWPTQFSVHLLSIV